MENNNDNLVDSVLLKERSTYYYDKQMDEQNEYQNQVVQYLNNKHDNNIKKQYNPKIVDLYHDGLLVIDNIEYRLKDFFIIFDDRLKDFHLKCINPKFKTKEINYNKAIRFIDTTSFINLINNSKTINNRIILDNIDNLNNIVSNWDGNIHSEVLETDSIVNKNVVVN